MDDKEKLFDQYGFSEEDGAGSAPDFGTFMNKVDGINTDSLKPAETDGEESAASYMESMQNTFAQLSPDAGEETADADVPEELRLSAAEAARHIFEDVVVEEKSYRPATLSSDSSEAPALSESIGSEAPSDAVSDGKPDREPSPFREAPQGGSESEDTNAQKGAETQSEDTRPEVRPANSFFHNVGRKAYEEPEAAAEETAAPAETPAEDTPAAPEPSGEVLHRFRKPVLPEEDILSLNGEPEDLPAVKDDKYWSKMDDLLNSFDDGEVHAGLSQTHYNAVSRRQAAADAVLGPETEAEAAGASSLGYYGRRRKQVPEDLEFGEDADFRMDGEYDEEDGRPRHGKKKSGKIFPTRGDSVGEVIRKLIVIISALTLIGCGVYFGYTFYMARHNVSSTTTLSNLLVEGQDKVKEDWGSVYAKHPDVDFPEGMQIKFADIYAMNQDLIGWVTIEGLNIDFPIVQAEDDEFYLRRNFNKEYSVYGMPFLMAENTNKGLDENMVIYGHSMRRDDQMFTPLKAYKTVDGFKKNPIISYSTLYNDYKFKVYAAFITNGAASGDNGYLFNFAFANLATKEDFAGYKKQLDQRKLYTTGVDLKWTDKMLVLSTCTYEFDDARFVVVGRLLRDDETEEVDVSVATENENPRYPQAWYDIKGLSNPYVDAEQWIPVVKVS